MVIPSKTYHLCRNGSSVSAELAKNPTEAPGKIAKHLFGSNITEDVVGERLKDVGTGPNDLHQALECGNFRDTKPSELFLRMYHDAICTLEKNPILGVCSPSLMGSIGVCPLTIFSTIPDICRHMSNVIVRAEREVYLATNFWMHSEPSRLITNAIRELNRKALAMQRKIVVKIIYDRGNLKQVVNNHQSVPPKIFADPEGPVRIPHPDEVPGLALEVVNFHRPVFGTFHAKYMVVDRKIAILQSNNIQDNDNCEMMAQYEGPIVDSFYDVALISWHNALNPPLPCLDSPAANIPLPQYPTFGQDSFIRMFNQQGQLVPTAQGSSNPVPDGANTLQDISAQGAQTNLPQHTADDPHYDTDIATETLRAVSFLNPRNGERRIDAITRLLNTTIQKPEDTKASAPEIEPHQMMTPLIPIPPHRPFPCAMVCREPWGSPGKNGVYTPQNEAFISGFRHAKESVFIQTPNLNAEGLLPEIIAACRRGVRVWYYYCLGYNDAGELLPGQGGHNEAIAHGLYKELEQQYHQNLDIYAYVAKDQVHPIHNKFKKRSCHIKIMVVDGHIGIMGNGNQDTQTWYHSQEINIMIDSATVCSKWMEGIRQNQNSHLYGLVQKEGEQAGCWIDPQTGKQAEMAIGVDAGHFAWAKGVVGAVQRVRGAGGF